MSLTDFVQYVWIPVIAFMWNELRTLRDKVEKKASKEDIADYLNPRMEKVENAVEQTQRSVQDLSARTHELIMTIMEWQRQQDKRN